MSDSEVVMCVTRQFLRDIHPNLLSNGFTPLSGDPAELIHSLSKNTIWVSRKVCETDPRLKQIIPYIVVRVGEQVIAYRRSPESGESRLHGKISIGFGGHINKDDTCYRDGMWREVTEELRSSPPYTLSAVGTVNDESNAVGSVHLGVVHLLDCTNVEALEKVDYTLIRPDYLVGNENLEIWSRMVLEWIVKQ